MVSRIREFAVILTFLTKDHFHHLNATLISQKSVSVSLVITETFDIFFV